MLGELERKREGQRRKDVNGILTSEILKKIKFN